LIESLSRSYISIACEHLDKSVDPKEELHLHVSRKGVVLGSDFTSILFSVALWHALVKC
jgi:hypothetical protein